MTFQDHSTFDLNAATHSMEQNEHIYANILQNQADAQQQDREMRAQRFDNSRIYPGPKPKPPKKNANFGKPASEVKGNLGAGILNKRDNKLNQKNVDLLLDVLFPS